MNTNDAFFKKYFFLHTHIEKCGGSTLIHYLETLFGAESICDLRPFPPLSATQILTKHPDIRKKLTRIKVLSGHIHYNTPWSKIIPVDQWFSRWVSPAYFSSCRKKPLYIASIRHPIDRLISLFRYVRTRPEHILYDEHIKNNSLDGFIQKLVQTNSFRMNNEICTLFIGRRNASQPLAEAKAAFHCHYFAVTPFNKTHELAHMLSDVLQLPVVTENLINPSDPQEKAALGAKTRTLLEEKCQNDILFYQYMMDHYQAKMDKAQKQLSSYLSKTPFSIV